MHTKVSGFCKAPLSKQCVEGHIKPTCLVHTKSNDSTESLMYK